jgi:predicted RNase H-like nuclease (RuvC/YqgF family)
VYYANSTTKFLANESDVIQCGHYASGNFSDGFAIASVDANHWATESLTSTIHVTAGDAIQVMCSEGLGDGVAVTEIYTNVTATLISADSSSSDKATKGHSTARHRLPQQ